MERILRRPAVEAQTGLSRSTIYEQMGAGKFPRPVPLGGEKAVGWLDSEISKWIEERIAEREAWLKARPVEREDAKALAAEAEDAEARDREAPDARAS